jgi:hypothetical protein
MHEDVKQSRAAVDATRSLVKVKAKDEMHEMHEMNGCSMHSAHAKVMQRSRRAHAQLIAHSSQLG